MKLEPSVATGCVDGSTPMAWHGMVKFHEGAPVAVSGWVLTDRHDPGPCAASSLHRGTDPQRTELRTDRGLSLSKRLTKIPAPCTPFCLPIFVSLPMYTTGPPAVHSRQKRPLPAKHTRTSARTLAPRLPPHAPNTKRKPISQLSQPQKKNPQRKPPGPTAGK